MNNENNENVYNNYDMFGQEVEEHNNYNYNRNILNISEYLLFVRINEYNIAEHAYEEMEENMIRIAMIESENSYISHERNPKCIINTRSLKFKDCKHKETCCTICITEYTDEDEVSILKCNHIYHNKCIIEWGMYRQECPMCRASIEIKEEIKEEIISIEDKINEIIIETKCSREQAIKTLRECNEEINESIEKIINGYNSIENDEGIESNDIETVMNYGSCTRDEAIRSLKEHGKVVEAIEAIVAVTP